MTRFSCAKGPFGQQVRAAVRARAGLPDPNERHSRATELRDCAVRS
ncbi:hypothetical protein ACFPM0_22665 [Pseudonocardia sulfidoxydans]